MPEKMDNIFWISYPIHKFLAKAKYIEWLKTSTIVHLETQNNLWRLGKNNLVIFYKHTHFSVFTVLILNIF